MLMVGCGYDDGIDVFAIEDRAIVTGGEDAAVLHRLTGGLMAGVVEIANGDALDAGHAQCRLQQLTTPDTRANRSETNRVAGGDGSRGG